MSTTKIKPKRTYEESPWKNNGGHNKKFDDPVRVLMYCESQTREELRAIAKKEGKSVNDILLTLAKNFIEKNKATE